MAQDEQLVFAFAHEGPEADTPLGLRLQLRRLKFMEELSKERATVDHAWRRVALAVSAFAHLQRSERA